MRPALRLCLALVAAAAPLSTPAPAQSCAPGETCAVRLTAPQLLLATEKLVLARQFDAAKPMLAALENAPELSMQRHFLAGYVAVETGDLDGAIAHFRAVLRDHPQQTRVRLELARAMMLKGQDMGADHHLRLAQQDDGLPPEIAATIRSNRGIIRDRRSWHFNVDVGFAPDSNINNATRLDSIGTVYDDIKLELDDEAKAKSGVGRLTGLSGGFRFRMGDRLAMLIDADGQFADYKGKRADDLNAQIAIGPELKLDERTTLSLQAVGSQRWYGGELAVRQVGIKAGAQRFLDAGQRIGLQLDARQTFSGFSPAYEGWQLGAYGTYERVVGRSMIASATLFARRDALASKSYSSSEAGLNLGIGGELPLGINAGLSGGFSHVAFDAPIDFLSTVSRKDFRINARAYVGLRSLRVLGFSPSLTYSYARAGSNYEFYRTDRHRLRFNMARYF
jgi:hypothetical protein